MFSTSNVAKTPKLPSVDAENGGDRDARQRIGVSGGRAILELEGIKLKSQPIRMFYLLSAIALLAVGAMFSKCRMQDLQPHVRFAEGRLEAGYGLKRQRLR